MSQQYHDVYSEYPSNQSPGRSFNSGLSLNRQSSRHFDSNNSFGPNAMGLYTAEDHAQHYGTTRGYDRMAAAPTIASNYAPYDSQTWNVGGAGSGAHTVGGTSRMKHSSRRAGLPNSWLDHNQFQSMPPPPAHNSHILSPYQTNGQYNNHVHARMAAPGDLQDPHDPEDLIPTAIVIKNIPFAVKKEALINYMTEAHLPLPYAFNYHFDNGVFRGLAFANFTTADETAEVIKEMNGFEIMGRKLRVEYKKMLPASEREKIERDKRERRGQLEEQHRGPGAMSTQSIHPQSSMGSLMSGSRQPTSPSPGSLANQSDKPDLNDPLTLGFYNELILFKSNHSVETMSFMRNTAPAERRLIHILAHYMGLEHRSEGSGDTRYVQIFKTRQPSISPTMPNYFNANESRRGLARAATIDGIRENNEYHSLSRQSSDLLNIPASPGLSSFGVHNNLRAAKSFADLRSYTPSPVPSSASFPANLAQNAVTARYTDYPNQSATHPSSTGTPNLTPTSGPERSHNRDDAFLVNSIGSLGLGGAFDRPNNRTNGGRIGQERENHIGNTGPIGSSRPMNGNFDDNTRNGVPERQPRGPVADWGSGFARPRQNGHVNRGSDSSDRSIPTGRYN